jgi:hypothetical protein
MEEDNNITGLTKTHPWCTPKASAEVKDKTQLCEDESTFI